jgi:immune inhibitor A
VDAVVVIAAGTGAEVTGNVNDIWSHQWGISPKTVGGVKVQSYFMGPEDGLVGVMAHELGHLLMGWPDLYDLDYSSSGTGAWDLMAGGSWNNGGNTPAHPSCYCKVKAGWLNPVTLFNEARSVTIEPYHAKGQAFRLPIGDVNSKEYFLVANRRKAGFDGALPGEGMSIEHVDETRSNNTDETHYLVDFEQADGRFDLNHGTNRGDSNDPFPLGATTSFTATTTPTSKAYDGSDSKVSITSIQRSGSNITADINVGGAVAKQWYYNKAVKLTFAHYTSKWAWAYIDTVGWRRIQDAAADGVTNLFAAFCDALATGHNVHVCADATFIYTMYLV